MSDASSLGADIFVERYEGCVLTCMLTLIREHRFLLSLCRSAAVRLAIALGLVVERMCPSSARFCWTVIFLRRRQTKLLR